MANTFKFGNGNWATKEDSVLAYNDENNNFKPLPFDFTRASTATYVDSDGLIKTAANNEARIDYLGNTNGHLLLEPSKTNSLLHSNQFDTTWSATNLTVTSGQTGVGGSVDAWKLSSTGSSSRLAQTISTSGQKSYTIYVKKGSLNFIRVFARDTGDLNPSAYFDLSKGIVSSEFEVDDATIKNIGNGWYRCEVVFTKTIQDVRIYPAQANGDISQTSGDIYIQNSQLESGSYATSYIPTSGSAVTRVQDICNNGANEQVINSTEGVLYVETSALSNDLSERRFGISDGTSSNVVRVGYTSVSNRIIAVIYNGSNQAVLTYTAPDITQNSKIAFKYKANDFALWVDGVERSTASSGSVFSANTLNSLDFNIGGGSHFYSKTKDVRLYNTALTDSELATLTT